MNDLLPSSQNPPMAIWKKCLFADQVRLEHPASCILLVLTRQSGSEAVEAAIKMSRQYFMELPKPEPKRVHFIARDRSYHGNTIGSLSLSGHKARRTIYEPILATSFSHVSPCYPYRGLKKGETDQQYVARLAQELEDEFQRVGPDTVCAFVAETVAGLVSKPFPRSRSY